MGTDNLGLAQAVQYLKEQVPNPSAGLPDEVFYYISQTTALVNVDLLIKDERGRTLLTWRNDRFCGQGWHIPGGIIRFRERLEERLQKVALSEIGCEVSFMPQPIALHQFIHHELKERAHFISFLYQCFLSENVKLDNLGRGPHDVGSMRWHEGCPADLLKLQEPYRPYIENCTQSSCLGAN